MDKEEFFKKCPACGASWRNRDDFMNDPEVELIGYQAHFEELSAGLFLFNHACNTTFSITVDKFADIYKGEIFQENRRDTQSCPGYCVKKSELRPCPAKCECSFVREIMQVLNSRRNSKGNKTHS